MSTVKELQALLLASEARANAAEAQRDAEAKRAFFLDMRAISASSAADTTNNSDEIRRGAPTPQAVLVDALLGGFPAPIGDVAAAAWTTFAAVHESVVGTVLRPSPRCTNPWLGRCCALRR